MGLCKLCNAVEANVNAHIIPKSFFVEHLEDGEIPKIISTEKGSYPKRSPIGVYDSDILCTGCEGKFAVPDDYGYKFFHAKHTFEVIYPGTEATAKIINDVDTEKLQLFVLSVLWRASVSKKSFYASVSLGQYEEKIRKIIEEQVYSHEFPILLRQYNYPPEYIPTLCPVKSRYGNTNYYDLLLNGFTVSVKVDKRPAPVGLESLSLISKNHILVFPRNYKGSKEHQQMLKAVKALKL